MSCEWYTNKIVELQQFIPFPEKYKKSKIDKNYSNVLEDKKINKFKHLFNLSTGVVDFESVDRTYKYKINFSNCQKQILKKYFNECHNIYNLCVNIWKEYNDVTDNWKILKDVIFDVIYRENNKHWKRTTTFFKYSSAKARFVCTIGSREKVYYSGSQASAWGPGT